MLLRTRIEPGQPTHILLAAMQSSHPIWLAELDPTFLWTPIHDAAEGGVWRVSDASGHSLYPDRENSPRGASTTGTLPKRPSRRAQRMRWVKVGSKKLFR